MTPPCIKYAAVSTCKRELWSDARASRQASAVWAQFGLVDLICFSWALRLLRSSAGASLCSSCSVVMNKSFVFGLVDMLCLVCLVFL